MDKLVICLFVALVAWASEAQAKPKAEPDELIAVAVVFRHGDRTIIETYPNDPYLNYSWPVGLGQLTNTGKRRVKEFGFWFRNRYSPIIPPNFKHLYVQTSNTSRTNDSLRLFLGELFDDTDDIKINLVPVEPNCPRYHKLYYAASLHMIKQLPDHLFEVFGYCAKHTAKRPTKMNYFETIHGVLENEDKENNLMLPDWTSNVYPERTRILSGLSFASRYANSNLTKLAMGPYFHFLVENFKKCLSGHDGYKLFVYSGHDTTVAGVLKALGRFDNIPPPYVSSVLIELRKRGVNPYINVYYKVDDILRPIILGTYKFNYPFENFVKLVRPITLNPGQWNQQCKVN